MPVRAWMTPEGTGDAIVGDSIGERPDPSALSREVHVWWTPTPLSPDPGSLRLLESWLSDEEATRFKRYVKAQDGELFLLAHALLRHSLSRYADVAPKQWTFARGEHGRPELSGPFAGLGLRFNLTHAPGLVACLVSDSIDAGIDVERTDRIERPLRLAERAFSTREYRELESLPPESLNANFYQLWTLKEAYVKARGSGFTLPLDGVRFSVRSGRHVSVEFDPSLQEEAAHWQFLLLASRRPPPGGLGLAPRCGGRPTDRVSPRPRAGRDHRHPMIPTPPPRVAVVILNWNGWRLTLSCLESVFRLEYPDFRVVVCDNDSSDGSQQRIREWAQGSVGLRHALAHRADYVWLLNNDALVHPQSLLELLKHVGAHPDIGMCGSTILHLHRDHGWPPAGLLLPQHDPLHLASSSALRSHRPGEDGAAFSRGDRRAQLAAATGVDIFEAPMVGEGAGLSNGRLSACRLPPLFTQRSRPHVGRA